MIITKFLQKYGYDTIDTGFYSKIEEWKSWYKSNVRRFHSYRIWLRSLVKIWLTFCLMSM